MSPPPVPARASIDDDIATTFENIKTTGLLLIGNADSPTADDVIGTFAATAVTYRREAVPETPSSPLSPALEAALAHKALTALGLNAALPIHGGPSPALLFMLLLSRWLAEVADPDTPVKTVATNMRAVVQTARTSSLQDMLVCDI